MSAGDAKAYVSEGAIADGTIYSQAIADIYASHFFYIEFYTDAAYTTLVDKSAMTGSVTFSATPSKSNNAGVDEEYLTVANGTLTLGTSDYTPPSASGHVKRVRAQFNTVVGATHYRLTVFSSVG